MLSRFQIDPELELNRSLMNLVLILIIGHFNSRNVKLWPPESYSGDACLVTLWFDGQSCQKTLEICAGGWGDRLGGLSGSERFKGE
jgi:hypothetical protein